MKEKKTEIKKEYLVRSWIVFAGVMVFVGILLVNLFSIQIIEGDNNRRRADGQYIGSPNTTFERGSIFFQEKDGTRMTAAGQYTGFKLTVNPSNFARDKYEVYNKISEIIDFDQDDFFKALEKKNLRYVELATRLSEEEAFAIKREVGNAVQIYPEKWRVYPFQTYASQTLGFLGYQGDEYAGRYGLERSYENILVRKDISSYTNMFARIFHNVQGVVDPENNQEGNIITTIDPNIQMYFEDKLVEIADTWNTASVGGIVMNPTTGHIYSLAVTPGYNNNNFSEYRLEDFKNPLVENVYEMGSIMKPLIVAAALDNGNITEKGFSYNDTGNITVGIHTIKNFDGRGRGTVGVQETLTQSLNTAMVNIGLRIPKQDFREYFLEKYAFGQPTGIDLPNEGKNLVSNLNSNRDIEFANISFGQGIAVTPIAMVQALSSLANGGKKITPHIVERIEFKNGLSKKIDHTAIEEQVLSPETSETISRMLVNVFDAYRNGSVKLPHHTVAAKTGTAQIPHPQGGYYDDRNLHSFFGYFPAYDPQFIVFLYAVHPKGVRYASETLIDPFTDVAKYLINYADIPPDR